MGTTNSDSGNQKQETPKIARLGSGGQQFDDLLDGCVGAVEGGFELAGRLMMGVGAVMEAAAASGPQRRLWKNKRAAQPEPPWT